MSWLQDPLCSKEFVCLLQQIVVFIALNCGLLSQKVNAHEDNLFLQGPCVRYLSTVITNKRLVSSCPVLLVWKTLLHVRFASTL